LTKLLATIFIASAFYSCATNPNVEWDHPTKTMAETWKQYYEECLDENPDNKKKCDELKEKYKMEVEKTRGMGSEPGIGDETYY